MFQILQVSGARAKTVIEEISVGSDPHLRFYALLIASAMIACFGLAADSTAVIIGAMLVSPLMTPIFGIALGMLQGNPRLMGRAFGAEFGGAALAVGSAYLVGLLELTAGEATSEMLLRTQPNLIDLLVAVFAGFAGAYALVDERISPALPGVAIATAIVPPLSTCGLCLSMGAYSGAAGALLLFLANFVSILVVALLTFALTGLARPSHIRSWSGFARRFAPTAAAFVVVTIVLTNSLIHIVRERAIQRSIEAAIVAQLADDQTSDLEEFVHHSRGDRVQVLAMVRSPRVFKPARVSRMRDAIGESLGVPVDLVVRTVLAKDVMPTGSSLRVSRPDLDGSFLTRQVIGNEGRESLAEQVIRERFESEPGFELTNIEYGTGGTGAGLVLAYVNSIRRLATSEIESLEQELRLRFDDPLLRFFVRVDSARLEHSQGPIRVEWTNWRGASESEIARLPEVEQLIRNVVSDALEVRPTHVHFNFYDQRRRVLVEVVGPHPVSPEDAMLVEERLIEELGSTIELHFWYRNEFVVNAQGYTTYAELSNPELTVRRHMLREIFQSDLAREDRSSP